MGVKGGELTELDITTPDPLLRICGDKNYNLIKIIFFFFLILGYR